MTEKESSFACDMSAIAADQLGAHLATINKLFRAVESFAELPHGYSFRLPNESDVLLSAVQFIALERLCCPFFSFSLEIEREGGAVWLSLTCGKFQYDGARSVTCVLPLCRSWV